MKVLDFTNETLILNKISGEKHLKVEVDSKKSNFGEDFKSVLRNYNDDRYEITESHKTNTDNAKLSYEQMNNTDKTNSKDNSETKQKITTTSNEDNTKFNNENIVKSNENVDDKKLLKNAENVSRRSIRLNENDVFKNINIINFKHIQEPKKVSNDKTNPNLEVYLLSLVRVISEIGKITEVPSDIKQKISEIRSKVLEGKVNIVELSNLLAEIKKLSKSSEFSQKINLDNLVRDFEQVLVRLKDFSNSDGNLLLVKLNETNNSERIVVNDYRQSDNKNVEKREVNRNEVFNLSTPIRNEVARSFNVSQQVVSNTSNNFFIQFNMLSNAVNEFSGRVVINLRNNVNEMKMTLFPPELGKVSVKFESTGDGKLIGNIVVSSREAYTLFQEHLNVIKDNLANQGFNVVRIDINFDNMLGSFGNERFGRGENTQMENLGKFFRFNEKKEEYEYTSRHSIYHDGAISLYA